MRDEICLNNVRNGQFVYCSHAVRHNNYAFGEDCRFEEYLIPNTVLIDGLSEFEKEIQ